MNESLFFTVIVVLALMVLLAGMTGPLKRGHRQRWWDDQMDSEEPFQMGSETANLNQKATSYSKDP